MSVINANSETTSFTYDAVGTFDEGTNHLTGVANHRKYDSFGNLTGETNSAVDLLFGFTGRLYDEITELQNNTTRWYDARVGKWLSEDWITFAAGDPNLARYVGNGPNIWTDPPGLERLDNSQILPPIIKFREKKEAPTALFRWGQDYGIRVYTGSPTGYYRNLGGPYIELDFGEVSIIDWIQRGLRNDLAPAGFAQELFHAWYNNYATWTTSCSWLINIGNRQIQFGRHRDSKVQEAR
jgi:RHS repeat-associated protein